MFEKSNNLNGDYHVEIDLNLFRRLSERKSEVK